MADVAQAAIMLKVRGPNRASVSQKDPKFRPIFVQSPQEYKKDTAPYQYP